MQSQKIKLVVAFFLIVILLISAIFFAVKMFFLFSVKPPETYVAELKDSLQEIEEKIEIVNSKKVEDVFVDEKNIRLPERIFIKVPFTSQAPFGVWDERHKEACEEASLVMIYAYLAKKELTRESAEKEIQKLIEFQIKNYGDFKDTNAEQTVNLFKDFYGKSIKDRLKVVYDINKEALKEALARGNPVIAPVAGRELGNPYFTAPGPLYHNLVLTGYVGNQIITNDPGTRRGENYRYDLDVLFEAIHDFPGNPTEIRKGRKAMIVIEGGD